MPSFFTVLCGTMEPGQWTLRVFQDGVQDARHYELPLVVLPSSADLPSDPDLLQSIDLLQGLWTVEKVTLLPLSDYYGDSPKLPSRDSKRPTLSPREEDKAKKQENEEEKREEEKLEKQKRDKDEEAEKKKKEEEEEEEKKKTEKEEGEIKEETRAHVKDVHLPPRSRRSAEDELHFGFHHDDPVFSGKETEDDENKPSISVCFVPGRTQGAERKEVEKGEEEEGGREEKRRWRWKTMWN
nr:protein MNN4-like isoform X2 [Penaeus vannamei]